MSNTDCNTSGTPEMDYFMNEELSDVVFIINGERLPALKAILSLKSRVFRAMFSENFRESLEKEVVIKDTTFTAFKTLIRFMHCEKLALKDGTDFDLIRDIYQLADRYDVSKLRDKLRQHLNEICLKPENLEPLAKLAIACDLKDLMQSVLKYFDNNLDDLVNNGLKNIFQLDDSFESKLIKIMANRLSKNFKDQLWVGTRASLTEAQTKLAKYHEKVCNGCNAINYFCEKLPKYCRHCGQRFR